MTTETYTPENLIAGSQMPIVDDKATILTGQTLTRGALLGKVTADGKLKHVDSAAVDGSQTVYAVLAEDVDSSAADVETIVYLTGEFNEAAVTVGGSDAVADHKTDARKIGIFLKSVMSA